MIDSHVLFEIALIEKLFHIANITPIKVPIIAWTWRKKLSFKWSHCLFESVYIILGNLDPSSTSQHVKNSILKKASEPDWTLIRRTAATTTSRERHNRIDSRSGNLIHYEHYWCGVCLRWNILTSNYYVVI